MGQVFSNFIENCNCGSSANVKDEEIDKEINKLHQSISEINREIKTIKENHLHHIEQSVAKIETDMTIMKDSNVDMKIKMANVDNNIQILLTRTASRYN